MTKEEILEAKKELIDMLVWAYVQGYQHAAEVVKSTVPTEEQLKDMFAGHMLKSVSSEEGIDTGDE